MGLKPLGWDEGVHRLEEVCEPSEAVYFGTSLSGGMRKLAERLFLRTQLVLSRLCWDSASCVACMGMVRRHLHMRSVVSTVLRIPAQTRQ